MEGWDDPILLHGYAASLMLDQWFRFHEITGDEDDATYQRVVQLRRAYRKGEKDVIEGNPVPPAEPSLIRLPHTKGSTPDREKPPTESKLAESDYVFDESEEEGEVGDIGYGDGFTGLGAQMSYLESETEYRGREEWRGACKAEDAWTAGLDSRSSCSSSDRGRASRSSPPPNTVPAELGDFS